MKRTVAESGSPHVRNIRRYYENSLYPGATLNSVFYDAGTMRDVRYRNARGDLYPEGKETAVEFHLGAERPILREGSRCATVYGESTRELTFDIDLTDYDATGLALRYGCPCPSSGKTMCRECAFLLDGAVAVLNFFATEVFRFGSLLWTYSGNRGVHLWINDPIARSLTKSARTTLFEIVDLASSTERLKSNLKDPVSPRVRFIYESVLEPLFRRRLLDDAGLFESPAGRATTISILNLVDEELADYFRTSQEKGNALWNAAKTRARSPTNDVDPCAFLVFRFLYPVMDRNVTVSPHHQVKQPFSAHAATGKVELPFDPNGREPFSFDPDAFPSVADLLAGGGADSFRKGVDLLKKFGDRSKSNFSICPAARSDK